MAVRDEVRDAQRALAILDAAHRRAVARLDQALARRSDVLAEVSNPAETGHPIRFKPATQSGRNRPPNPVDSGHVGLMRLGV